MRPSNKLVLECNVPVSSDTDDTASSARTSPELSGKGSISEISSNEGSDGFSEASPHVVPALPEKEKEELESAPPEESNEEIVARAQFREKKQNIISTLESLDMDREDELCVIGIRNALEKAKQKFEGFSEKRKLSREGKSLKKWIIGLEKQKTFLRVDPPSMEGPEFQIYDQGAKREWQFREVMQSWRNQCFGGLGCIRLATTEVELQSVLRAMNDKLCEAHRQKNASGPSEVSRLLTGFVDSRCQDFSLFGWKPLPTSPEKKQVLVAKNAERPNDLPVIFAVCKVVLQFLLDLLTAFVEAQAKSGSFYAFVR